MYSDLINIKDFSCVGVVTSSCNSSKLCIAINDAFAFDLEGLLCYDFMHDIISNWRELNTIRASQADIAQKLRMQEITQEEYDEVMIPLQDALESLEHYSDIIEGAVYQDCADKSQRHLGIRTLWVYYAYAHYIKINPFDDTPNGLVHKGSEFSLPVPVGELNSFSTSYRNRAKIAFDKIKDYLCLNKDLFAKFDACDCRLSCGCSGSCRCGSTKKIRGFKYKSVQKK